MNTAKRFTNFSDEDFTGEWNSEKFLIKKGETLLLQDYLAEHFAKHLIDRELNKQKINTSLQVERQKLYNLICGSVEVESSSPEKLETEILNKKEEVKKEDDIQIDTPKIDKKSKDEESFEGN